MDTVIGLWFVSGIYAFYGVFLWMSAREIRARVQAKRVKALSLEGPGRS